MTHLAGWVRVGGYLVQVILPGVGVTPHLGTFVTSKLTRDLIGSFYLSIADEEELLLGEAEALPSPAHRWCSGF